MSHTLEQFQLLARERVVSIRELQKNPTKALQGITRVMKNGKSVGFFLDEEVFENFIEDIEALLSPNYQASIQQAMKEVKAGKGVTLEALKKEYGL